MAEETQVLEAPGPGRLGWGGRRQGDRRAAGQVGGRPVPAGAGDDPGPKSEVSSARGGASVGR